MPSHDISAIWLKSTQLRGKFFEGYKENTMGLSDWLLYYLYTLDYLSMFAQKSGGCAFMQHLVIEIRQGDPITVTRTRRLSPNRHLLGISTELVDLMIHMLVKARKEGIVRHWRDAVSTQGRTARRLCPNSLTNSTCFKFYSQSPAFEVPLSWTLWPPRNPKTPTRYCMTTTIASPPAWSIRSFPLYMQALPVK